MLVTVSTFQKFSVNCVTNCYFPFLTNVNFCFKPLENIYLPGRFIILTVYFPTEICFDFLKDLYMVILKSGTGIQEGETIQTPYKSNQSTNQPIFSTEISNVTRSHLMCFPQRRYLSINLFKCQSCLATQNQKYCNFLQQKKKKERKIKSLQSLSYTSVPSVNH